MRIIIAILSNRFVIGTNILPYNEEKMDMYDNNDDNNFHGVNTLYLKITHTKSNSRWKMWKNTIRYIKRSTDNDHSRLNTFLWKSNDFESL